MVFPTRVGMVRMKPHELPGTEGFPHSRGDGPDSEADGWVPFPFSPLAWGWSVIQGDGAVQLIVFPTRVGMVRA